MNGKNERTRIDMVENLLALVYETDTFPSSEEAKEFLAEEGIDTSSLNLWASEKLKEVKARQSLVLARERRLALDAKFEELARLVEGSASALRKKVLDKIRVLGESDPEGAQVFCRKFEEVPDEDLADLDAELSLLDVMAGEGDGFNEDEA
jgi:hypothetical protein